MENEIEEEVNLENFESIKRDNNDLISVRKKYLKYLYSEEVKLLRLERYDKQIRKVHYKLNELQDNILNF